MKRTIFLVILFVLGVSISCFSSQKTILVIESYDSGYPWDISYKKGIESVLAKDYNIVYFEMDTKRLPPDQYEKRAQLAYEMYKKNQPVLVILGDDNALKFVGPKLSDTKTPVVYLGINNNPRDYGLSQSENITGILERPLMKRSIIYISELIEPKLEKMLILFDSGNTSKISVREMFNDKASVSVSGVQVDLQLIGKLSDWKKAVLSARMNGYGAIVVGLYQTIVDENGKHVSADEIIDWTSKNTLVPPFGFWDFTVGKDLTIGGLVLFGQTQGEEAATIALEILSGKKPNQIPPVMGKKGRFFFSRSQLAKWQITLPDHMASKADYTE
ncbi:MAG: ABC transporter substrate binding protein [Pseudomonadota bacterium]